MSPTTKGCVLDGGWGGGGHIAYCFWDGSHGCRCRRQRKTSCPFGNLNTFWNILMILGRNVDQDEMMCSIQH